MFDKTKTVENLTKIMVKETPNKIFVKHINENYTWLDIEKASQILAKDLTDIGIKKGSHVGLCSPNSANWIITFFALCKLQATIVMLNPMLNTKEISLAIEIGDIEFICYGDINKNEANRTFIDDLKDNKTNIKDYYYIGNNVNYKERFAEYDSIANLYCEESEKDESRIFLYTSGSTGVPKIAMHSINNIFWSTINHVNAYQLNENDKHCLILPLFHIFALYTIFLPAAMSNGMLVIPDNIKTSTVIDTIKKEQCTVLNTVPTMMIALFASKSFDADNFKSLKMTMIGGGAATPDQMKKFQDAMPHNHLISGYGATEICPISQTLYTDSIEQVAISVGKPYNGIEVFIQNYKTLEHCKDGETGEIVVRGYSNMLGYYKAPKDDETLTSDGWIHTGDLGYINELGNICINGRIKEIIIKGGENIMPVEIANAIIKNESIKDAKVIGIPDEFRGEEVVACITIKRGCVFNEEETRYIMSKHISQYKMPKYFVIYEDFPKLGSGKIDIKKLKQDAIEKIKNI